MCVSRLMTPNEICAVVLSVWLTRLTVKKKKNVECCSRDGKYTVHIIHIIRLCARQRAYICLLRLFVHALRVTAARRSLSLLPASVILSHFLRRTLTEFRVSRELSATLLLIIYVKIGSQKTNSYVYFTATSPRSSCDQLQSAAAYTSMIRLTCDE